MKRNTLKEIMEQSLTVNGKLPYVWVIDGSRYLVIELATGRIINTYYDEEGAIANAYYWNCKAFAKKCIKDKDGLLIEAGMYSKDKVMKDAFIRVATDKLIGE